MHIVLRFIATFYIFASILISWILIWLIQTIVKIFMFPFASKDAMRDACGHIFRKVSWVFVDLINPFWYSRVLKPFPKMQKGEKFIVVMNHLSNADPWFAIRPIFPWDCKWICKGSLFKVPFGGWGLANNGDLAIKFTKEKGGWGTEKGSVGLLMEDAKKLLQRAQPIAVFPEGVRNPKPDGPVGEFKLGFFNLAVQEGAKIVPIALSGSETAWPRGDWKFDSATCYFSCAEPIDPTGMTAEELCKKVHDVISELRETHPDRQKLKKSE